MTPDLGSLVGRTLGGRYRVVRPIGHGGMGAVFEAEQLDLGRSVAIKALFDLAGPAVARLRQEAMSAGSLQSPHVVTILDFQANDGEPPFLVMEMLPGEPLSALLRRERALDPTRAVRIAVQMLAGLDAAHGAGITHRDIKPSNVWLVRTVTGEDHVKLLDFGIAKVHEDAGGVRTTTGSVLGTPSYLAPEQLRGLPADARSDVHAVGVVLFEMLAGAKPWSATGPDVFVEILERSPLPVRTHVAAVPPVVSDAVERALRKDPRERFQTAVEMMQALARGAPPASSVATPTRPHGSESPPTLAESPEARAAGVSTGPGGERAPSRGVGAPRAARSAALVFLVAVVVVLLLGVAGLGLALAYLHGRAPDAGAGAGDAGAMVAPVVADPVAAPALPTETDAESDAEPATGPLDRAADASTPPPAPRKPDSTKCLCINRDFDNMPLCITPLVRCECIGTGERALEQLCPVQKTIDERGNTNCPVQRSARYGPTTKSGDPCSGWSWDYKRQENVEVPNAVLRCTHCEGHKEYPGYHGATCRGVRVDGEWARGVWECPRR